METGPDEQGSASPRSHPREVEDLEPIQDRVVWLRSQIVHYANNVRDDFDGLNFVVDGAGQPVVFIQGNPAWSFAIRHLTQVLHSVVQVGVAHGVAALAVPW